MDSIKTILENSPLSRGLQQQTELTSTAIPLEGKSKLTENDLIKFWLAMAQMYGHKLTSTYGDAMNPVWKMGLKDLSLDELRCGFKFLMGKQKEEGNDWPPSLPEFLSYCKRGKPVEYFAAPERAEQTVDEQKVINRLVTISGFWLRMMESMPAGHAPTWKEVESMYDNGQITA